MMMIIYKYPFSIGLSLSLYIYIYVWFKCKAKNVFNHKHFYTTIYSTIRSNIAIFLRRKTLLWDPHCWFSGEPIFETYLFYYRKYRIHIHRHTHTDIYIYTYAYIYIYIYIYMCVCVCVCVCVCIYRYIYIYKYAGRSLSRVTQRLAFQLHRGDGKGTTSLPRLFH